MGPTAAGKTKLAMDLVEQLPCDIISVDSALVYQGMDIGTAKPNAAELAKAPHRLMDFLDPASAYSAATFRQDALREIEDILAQGRIPLLVGGTMLYYKALASGLAKMPEANAQIRERLDQQAQQIGWAAMHQRLQQIDPVAAERIHQNDTQRLQRALEVHELSGITMTELLQQQEDVLLPYDVVRIILAPENRHDLDERIALRFNSMLQQGFIEEVKQLKARTGLTLENASMRAVGYRQVWEFLDGQCTEQEMLEKSIHATIQLAKRQYTWLRKEQKAKWFSPFGLQLEEVLLYLRAYGVK